MVRDTVGAPARRGAAGLPRRRALLRRLPRQPRLRPRGAAHGVRRGRRGGRAVRHQRRDAARLGRRRGARRALETTGVRVGIHCHNDTGCAVANTLAAVDAGATHVQGTLNGYGERTGNADLVSVVANLELKLGRPVLPEGRLRDATRIAHAVAEVTNFPPASRQPYVGSQRVRAQGRAARQRDQGRPEPLPAHGAGARRQRHEAAGLRHGRPRVSIELKGARARLRPRLGRPGAGHPDHRPGQGAGVARATRSRRPTRPSSCCSSRRSRGPVRRTSTSSRGG